MIYVSPFILFKTMETCEDGNDLVFFYQVCGGVANASHASHTAAQAGLPEKLIARGKEVKRSMHPTTSASGVPSIVPIPLGHLGSWAHRISDPNFLFPTPSTFLPVLGLRLDPQWKTYQACEGVVKGEPNAKVSVWPGVFTSSAAPLPFTEPQQPSFSTVPFKDSLLLSQTPKSSRSWVSCATAFSLCSGTQLTVLP